MLTKEKVNKIYSIGKNPKTITITQSIDNRVEESFEVYKCVRRKNKLLCSCLNTMLIMTFDTLNNTIKTYRLIKKELNNG